MSSGALNKWLVFKGLYISKFIYPFEAHSKDRLRLFSRISTMQSINGMNWCPEKSLQKISNGAFHVLEGLFGKILRNVGIGVIKYLVPPTFFI